MSIIHTRHTGKAQRDADKITGADWDDPHVYGLGSVFPLLSFGIDYAGNFFTTTGPFETDTGAWIVYLGGVEQPIPPGCDLRYSVSVTPLSLPLPDGWSFRVLQGMLEQLGTLRLELLHNSYPANSDFGFRFYGVVYAHVVAAQVAA